MLVIVLWLSKMTKDHFYYPVIFFVVSIHNGRYLNENNEEVSSQTEKLGKKIFRAPNGNRTHDPPDTSSSVVRASTWYLEGHGFDSRWGLGKFFFRVFRFEN